MQAVKTIGIIGAGNLAWSLIPNLQAGNYSVEQVIGRSDENLQKLVDEYDLPLTSTELVDLHPDLDFIFLAVGDKEIASVAASCREFGGKNSIYLHCSGSVDISVLEGLGIGQAVLWPLQSLTRGKVVKFTDVPVFIEGSELAKDAVRDLAQSISGKVIYTNSQERRTAHLAAVVAGNFSNLLYAITEKLTKDIADVDLSTYSALIREVLSKSLEIGPHEALTGPARRDDISTMNAHVAQLEAVDPKLAEMYRLLSEMIKDLKP